jgi:UDP-glucose 4-epimerase
MHFGASHCVVTGGQGFLGSHVVNSLLKKSNTKISLFDYAQVSMRMCCLLFLQNDHILAQVVNTNQLSKVARYQGNISSFNTVYDLLKTTKPTHIIHLGISI